MGLETDVMIHPRIAPITLLIVLLAGCATSVPKQVESIVTTQREADDAYAHGDMQLALQRYQALTKAMPKEASYWFRLGNVEFKLMQPDAAIAAYQQAITLNPGYTEALYNLGIVRLRMAQAAFVEASRQDAAHDPLAERSAHFAYGIATLTNPASAVVHGDAQEKSVSLTRVPDPVQQGGAAQ
jgi:tetratricopeptide (TPR) repeat protein